MTLLIHIPPGEYLNFDSMHNMHIEESRKDGKTTYKICVQLVPYQGISNVRYWGEFDSFATAKAAMKDCIISVTPRR